MSLLPVIDPNTVKQHCIAVNYENNSGPAAFAKTRRQKITVTCANLFIQSTAKLECAVSLRRHHYSVKM